MRTTKTKPTLHQCKATLLVLTDMKERADELLALQKTLALQVVNAGSGDRHNLKLFKAVMAAQLEVAGNIGRVAHMIEHADYWCQEEAE
jgi:hypothetical protein